MKSLFAHRLNNNNKKKNLEFFVKQEVSVTGTET